MIEIEYTISVLNIKEINASLNQLIPSEEVKGKYLNCNYMIYPKKGKITISGDNNRDILKCAKSIARNFSRKQNWGFYYDFRQTKITDDHMKMGRISHGLTRAVIIDIPMKTSLSSPPYDDLATLESAIDKEYALPAFYDLLFQEAIFNKTMKKHRIAFLMAYSTLENAIKLICTHHCNIPIKNKSIQTLFGKLEIAGIKLKTNVMDFNDGSRFKRIRNDIAHGSNKYSDLDIKEDLMKLLKTIDDILRELSPLLIQNEHHI